MRRHLWWMAALLGCGGGGGGGGDAAVAKDMAAPDVGVADAGLEGDASIEELAAAYCRDAARARCTWAFDCVPAGDRGKVFGFEGPAIDDCAEAEATDCLSDLEERLARGTVAFEPAAVARCVTGQENAPCPAGEPVDWARDWHTFVYEKCLPVARGTVIAGERCTTRNDCAEIGQICGEGRCRDPRPADILSVCEPESNVRGVVEPFEDCPGEACVALGRNREELSGMCSVDCTNGQGCPTGSYCIQVDPGGNRGLSYFCTQPCMEDDDCDNGLACVKVNPTLLADESRHCFVLPR